MKDEVLWSAVVQRIGAEAAHLAEAGMIVLFGEQAPPELQELAVVHRNHAWRAPCAPGDIMRLGRHTTRITAVGDLANQNLERLGHVTVKFNGRTAPELPGDLCVEALPVPRLAPGEELVIERRGQRDGS